MSGDRGGRSQLYVFRKKSTEKVKKIQDFGGSVIKNPPANAGETGSITGLGRSSEGGNGNPLQYSYLENPMKRGVQQATVQRAAESDRTEANKERCDKFLVVFQRWIR